MNDSPFAAIADPLESEVEVLAKQAAEMPSADKPMPNVEEIKDISAALNFSSREPTPSKSEPIDSKPTQRRRKRAKVLKTQFNNTISLDSLALFEKVAESLPEVSKGALVEKAIRLLAKEEGIQ